MNYEPVWVITAVPTPAGDDRVRVIASCGLTDTELRTVLSQWNWSVPEYRLTASFGDFIMVEGATYTEALNELLTLWSPETGLREGTGQ